MRVVDDVLTGLLGDALAMPATGQGHHPLDGLAVTDLDPRYGLAEEIIATRQSAATLRAVRPAVVLSGVGVGLLVAYRIVRG